MQDYYLGIDVGGTKTEACLLSLDRSSSDFHSYQTIARERMPTGRTTSLDDFLERLHVLVDSILSAQKLSIKDLKGLGIGLPGSIGPATQIMTAGSIPFFLNVPLVAPFRKKLGFNGTLVFDNDANCFALAEAYFGAGADWAKKNNVKMDELSMVGIIVGTGVGGGILVRGELIRGRRGGAGEIGHTTLVPAGRSCYCGKFGCVEQYVSGPAFQQSYSERTSGKEHLSASEIFKRIEEGDTHASATFAEYREHLVKFLSNLCNCIDPHVIVLGGGMSRQPKIYEGISEGLSRECFLTSDPPQVLPYQCGDSAGVFGAALLSFAANTRAHAPGGNA